MLDVRRLRVLSAVVSSGSVTAAARQLGYTTSAVSQQITVLERETGVTLLERAGRGVRPTEAARLLAAAGDDVTTRLRDAESALEALRAGRTGRLSLTCFPSAGGTLVPLAVATFRRRHPHVDLVLAMADPDVLLPAVRDGAVDVGVVIEPCALMIDIPGEEVLRVHLLDDPYFVLLPADHRLAAAPAVALADLAGETWVGTASTTGHCDAAAIDACRAAGFTPSYALDADEYPTTQGFVAAGVGVALVPGLALGFVHERVVVRPVLGEQPVRRVHAAVRPGRAGEVVVASALYAERLAEADVAERDAARIAMTAPAPTS